MHIEQLCRLVETLEAALAKRDAVADEHMQALRDMAAGNFVDSRQRDEFRKELRKLKDAPVPQAEQPIPAQFLAMTESVLIDAQKACRVLFTMLTKIKERQGVMVADEICAHIGSALKDISLLRSAAHATTVSHANLGSPEPAAQDARDAALGLAYGYLWHVNNMHPGYDAPADYSFPQLSPEKAAYAARKVLRDLLTNEQRGVGINAATDALNSDAAILAAKKEC